MVINKLLNEVSIQKIWKKFTQHEEIMDDKQKQIDELDDKFGGVRFGYSEDGWPGFYSKNEDGADTVIPFSGEVNLVALTPATALAGHITEGMTAWVNGELITGTRTPEVNSQSGSHYFGHVVSDEEYTVIITFKVQFDKVPKITLSISGANYRNDQLYAYNISRTGFSVLYEPGGTPGYNGGYPTLHWHATTG